MLPRNFSHLGRSPGVIAISDPAVHEGLRRHMLRVYNYMAGGIGLSALVALFAAASGLYATLITTAPFMLFVLALSPLVLVLILMFRIQKLSLRGARTFFWVFAGTMGLSLASVFLLYTSTSIVTTLLVTTIAFASLSLYGYTTKRDLSPMRSFLMMGLFGIIAASLVNLFLQNSMLDFVICAAGVLVFAGLTAWDTQSIKHSYLANHKAGVNETALQKVAVTDALRLYLDFINLFLMLLRFIGDRR